MSRRAHCSASSRPVAVDPVNIRASTLSTIDGPSSAPGPVTTCTRSRGTPARYMRSTSASAQNGVSESGLSRIPLPATSAGNASDAASVSG